MDKRIVKKDGISKVLTRGVMVVDWGLAELGNHLSKLNIRVIATDGCPEEFIADSILSGRILVTRRPQKFFQWSYEFEFGIISIKALSCKDLEKIATRISREAAQRKLWSKRHGYMVTLLKNGKSEYQELIG